MKKSSLLLAAAIALALTAPLHAADPVYPPGSRIGAWASEQSRPTTRETLQAREREFRDRYGDQPPRPPHWGGYRLVPDYFEFWQGRPSRLHDRLRYLPDGQGWKIDRLAP